jgi:hypothetical protein
LLLLCFELPGYQPNISISTVRFLVGEAVAMWFQPSVSAIMKLSLMTVRQSEMMTLDMSIILTGYYYTNVGNYAG